jgi:hypothetical protein
MRRGFRRSPKHIHNKATHKEDSSRAWITYLGKERSKRERWARQSEVKSILKRKRSSENGPSQAS